MVNQRNKKVSGLEHRYRRAVATIRSFRPSKETKELEKDIVHTIQHIQNYGFEFFPNHYIRDDVIRLEGMARQLEHALNK